MRPANTSAIVSAPARSVLTQSTWFSRRIGETWLRRLRHTSKVAGWSDTDTTAVAVKPAIPAGPAVVTTCTAAPSWLIASRNCVGSTVAMCSGA